jgi:outer membrane protein OmpA-like peptidoglycan-associated protein
VVYAAQVKKQLTASNLISSAGRGPAAVTSEVQVTFESGSASLSDLSREEIDLFLPALKSLKEGVIEVEGYADGRALANDSSFTSNLHLSGVRATNVAEYLIKKGVSPKRIKTVSFGDAFLYKDASVPSQRRVLIKIGSYKVNK